MLFYIYPVINMKQSQAFCSCSADIILTIRKKNKTKQNDPKNSTILSGRKKNLFLCSKKNGRQSNVFLPLHYESYLCLAKLDMIVKYAFFLLFFPLFLYSPRSGSCI